MAIGRGVVVKIKDGFPPKALVRTNRMTACDTCSSRKECCDVGEEAQRDIEVEISNLVDAQIGDMVLIELNNTSLFRAVFLIYIVPVISMVIGGLSGHWLTFFDVFAAFHTLPIFLSFLFLGLSFWGVRLIGRNISDKPEYSPKIIKIIK